MNAIDFVSSISKITPKKSDIKENTGFSDSFVDTYINDMRIVKKISDVNIADNNAILNLIYNYDLTKFSILSISFNKAEDIVEDENYIYIGWVEAFPFAIAKKTGEIVELAWEDPTFIVSYMAKDQCSFLDILIEMEKLNQKDILGSINCERQNELQQILNIAGGDKYTWAISVMS